MPLVSHDEPLTLSWSLDYNKQRILWLRSDEIQGLLRDVVETDRSLFYVVYTLSPLTCKTLRIMSLLIDVNGCNTCVNLIVHSLEPSNLSNTCEKYCIGHSLVASHIETKFEKDFFGTSELRFKHLYLLLRLKNICHLRNSQLDEIFFKIRLFHSMVLVQIKCEPTTVVWNDFYAHSLRLSRCSRQLAACALFFLSTRSRYSSLHLIIDTIFSYPKDMHVYELDLSKLMYNVMPMILVIIHWRRQTWKSGTSHIF